MPRLIWSPASLLDLQRLYKFLSEKNGDAARRAVRAIREGMNVIARQPGIGRPAEDMETEFREWLIGFGDSGYVVLYHFDGENAVILAIRHQRELGY
ncbi:type II toxin-antitoxin system RelE/ParE family toxin [Actimicrobium antarcticum]|uniref:Type II toxin-antitoxin system RelE/ParE family toxin n=1 Tax=Actimicrobium antarcticum TaxID=1051899 RepID=A0ABP7T4P0_9BURK